MWLVVTILDRACLKSTTGYNSRNGSRDRDEPTHSSGQEEIKGSRAGRNE